MQSADGKSVEINGGLRWEETEVDATALQSVPTGIRWTADNDFVIDFSGLTNVTDDGKYVILHVWEGTDRRGKKVKGKSLAGDAHRRAFRAVYEALEGTAAGEHPPAKLCIHIGHGGKHIARDEHAGVRRAHLLDPVQNGADGEAPADDLVATLHLTAQTRVLLHQAALL